MPAVTRFLALCALAASATAQPTCADWVASGQTAPCVATSAFSANSSFNGFKIPDAWRSPAPICYAQYINNQLATPTFMPTNSICSAYGNQGCCNSETVMSCAPTPPLNVTLSFGDVYARHPTFAWRGW